MIPFGRLWALPPWPFWLVSRIFLILLFLPWCFGRLALIFFGRKNN